MLVLELDSMSIDFGGCIGGGGGGQAAVELSSWIDTEEFFAKCIGCGGGGGAADVFFDATDIDFAAVACGEGASKRAFGCNSPSCF